MLDMVITMFFTTCNLDTPHFAFIAKKVKIINNKIAVSGPAYPRI
jgi:hypothetical protein